LLDLLEHRSFPLRRHVRIGSASLAYYFVLYSVFKVRCC